MWEKVSLQLFSLKEKKNGVKAEHSEFIQGTGVEMINGEDLIKPQEKTPPPFNVISQVLLWLFLQVH